MKTDKINILVPLAGKGQRFIDNGYQIPKCLITAGDRHIIDWSMQSIITDNCNLIFVIRNEHDCNYALSSILREKFGQDIQIVKTYRETKGSIDSCLHAQELIDNDTPLLVYCVDIYFEKYFDPHIVDPNLDGLILTFKSNSSNYSYTEVDATGKVINVVEKMVISSNANVGAYYFKKGSIFVDCSKQMIDRNLTTNNEFYIAPVYNLMVEQNYVVGIQEVEKMHVMGTPRELDFYVNVTLNKFGNGKVALCCDHSGFEHKEEAKKVLDDLNIKYVDYGAYTNKSCDQVDYTKMACRAIQAGNCTHGIGFCRSGQAINIAANKFNKIKAALIFNKYTAEYCIRHNGSNFFTISTKFIDKQDLGEVFKILKNSQFEGGRHHRGIL